jgi:hypothetical protein
MSKELTQADLPDIGKQIRDLHIEAWADYDRALERVRDAGMLLIAAKPLVGHGKWESWVSEHCRFESPQATKYMRVADRWDEIQQKRTSGSPLSINAAVKLIAAPKPKPTAGGITTGNTPREEGAATDDTPEPIDECPACKGTDFFPGGACRACIPDDKPTEPSPEPVPEPPDEPEEDEAVEDAEAAESAGTWFMLEMIELMAKLRWEFPDVERCTINAVCETVMAKWDD